MQLGMIGLGRMGGNMVRRLLRGGHQCVVYDAQPAAIKQLVSEGATGAESLADLVSKLTAPRAVWLMLPAGEITEKTVLALQSLLSKDDTMIDGGNSQYQDDIRRSRLLSDSGINYIDVGTSGGVWGLERGYCLMFGGPQQAVSRLDPVFRTLAPGSGSILPTDGRAKPTTADLGYLYCGPSGAGHFVKMVHNGIEYGMMQAFAEGFDLMNAMRKSEIAEERYDLNLPEIAEVWRRGSVVSSWLLDLVARALTQKPTLDGFTGQVADSGEGRWTVEAAIQNGVPVPNLAQALFARFRSRQENTFGEKLLSAMRFQFGGHMEKK